MLIWPIRAIVLLLPLLPSTALAAFISYGVSVDATFRQCVVGATLCDRPSPTGVRVETIGGDPGRTAAVASNTVADSGTAGGSVILTADVGAPVLRAFASADLGGRVAATVLALQRYTYTGTEATTRTFGGSLTYSQSLSDGPYVLSNGITAAIDVFTLPSAEIELIEGSDSRSALFLRLLNYQSLPGYLSLGSDRVTDNLSAVSAERSLGVTVSLEPGDFVWVWTLLQPATVNGSFSDASNTFITAWDNSSDLIAAGTVPSPGTLPLALTAILLGLARSRPRTDASQETPSK